MTVIEVPGEWSHPHKHEVILELITIALSQLDYNILGVRRHSSPPPKVEAAPGHAVVCILYLHIH